MLEFGIYNALNFCSNYFGFAKLSSNFKFLFVQLESYSRETLGFVPNKFDSRPRSIQKRPLLPSGPYFNCNQRQSKLV